MRKIFCLLAAGLFLNGCRSPEYAIAAVKDFNAAKYMGKWYEFARLPNWFEKDMNRVTATYTMLPDGKIKVVNQGEISGQIRRISGFARPADDSGSGELEVTFFRPFYSPYRIIKLADDYRYSIVAGSDENYLWVLSRTPQISPADWQEISAFLEENGFPKDKLIYPWK